VPGRVTLAHVEAKPESTYWPQERAMSYFSRILGLDLASAVAILNAAWFELDADRQRVAPPADLYDFS
jgi:cyd operon protein YbgT